MNSTTFIKIFIYIFISILSLFDGGITLADNLLDKTATTNKVIQQGFRKDIKEEWLLLSESPFIIDFGKNISIKGIIYTPQHQNCRNYTYNIYMGEKNEQWKKLKAGNVFNNGKKILIRFNKGVNGQYLKIEIQTAQRNKVRISLNEFGVTY